MSRKGSRAALTRFAALALLSALASPRAARAEGHPAGAPSDYATAASGRRFRVRFDPASRISAGVAGAASFSPAPHPALEITGGLSYRGIHESGAGKEQVTWQVDHRVLSGRVAPLQAAAAGVPAMDASVYAVSALRHDRAPTIVLPVMPPLTVPFPFDVGFDGEVGRVYVPPRMPTSAASGAPLPTLEVGVARAAFTLDPWRSGVRGRSLELGLGARYDIDVMATPSWRLPAVVHRVAPLTAASARFRYQSGDGLAVVDLRGEIAPHWTSEGIWRVAASTTARFERTLIAVNDQPFALFFEGGYRLLPPSREALPLHDARVSAGISFSLQLR